MAFTFVVRETVGLEAAPVAADRAVRIEDGAASGAWHRIRLFANLFGFGKSLIPALWADWPLRYIWIVTFSVFLAL